MRVFFSTLIAISFFACNSNTNSKQANDPVQPVATNTRAIPDCNTGLQFINDYVKFITVPKKGKSDSTWIAANPVLTGNFKLAYKNLLDSARKADPEMGLDFDPILDAQDFPDKGFELSNCDSTTGYVSVKGKDWKDFILIIKLVEQDNKWLVDGAGVINIPIAKRGKRE